MAAHSITHEVAHEDAKKRAESGVLWAQVSSKLLSHSDRRLEASTFLTDGFGLRQRLEVVPSTVPMSAMTSVWQPSRLKGFPVDKSKGLPFLSAGQVFESQSRVRKWLAEAMIPALDTRYVDDRWLLLSCSGEVGQVTAVYSEHLGKVITHDLLRVVPHDPADYGWLYAYLKTPTFFAIAKSAEYGHMIKHLEPEHVLQMPVAMPNEDTRRAIGAEARVALEKRRKARSLQQQADALYGMLVNPNGLPPTSASFGMVRSSELVTKRRRMEGQFHRADVRQIDEMIRSASSTAQPLVDLVDSVTVGARFKRYFGPYGTAYRSASELFDVNPPVTKRIYSGLLSDPDRYMLHAGWIIMACSGQTYGLLGRTTVLTELHEGIFGSHDLIRIVPDESKARTGYLHTVLNHIDYGRPRVIRYATGTSVPHLDPKDICDLLVPRFDEENESEIADLSDESTRLSAEADRLESSAVDGAERAITALTGKRGPLTLPPFDTE